MKVIISCNFKQTSPLGQKQLFTLWLLPITSPSYGAVMDLLGSNEFTAPL